jgi:pyruvate,orthophosphate dikinase
MLVRKETVPDDIHGMFVAQGILTATGGMTSHAAVVGRQMGKPSIVGAGALEIDERSKTLKIAARRCTKGSGCRSTDSRRSEDWTGRDEAERDSAGHQRRDEAEDSDIYQRFERCCRGRTSIAARHRANADQPDQAKIAYNFGARGIGLCRTEHMFFGEGRIPIVQK